MSFGSQHGQSAGFSLVGSHGHLPLGISPKKRRLEDGFMETDSKENRSGMRCNTPGAVQYPPPTRRFLSLPGSVGIYYTEVWRDDRSHTFLPITQDTLINTRHVDQISFTDGRFFLGDEAGSYCDTQNGAVIHLWRYDNEAKKSFISRSLLFLDKQVYCTIRQQLEEL